MISQENTNYRAYINEIRGGLRATLQSGLEFIQWQNYIDKNTRVFVKPNFTSPCPQPGVTTSPGLLECLLEILATRSNKVTLGESDGGNHSFTAEEAFEGHNMYQICQKTGVEIVNLSKLPSRSIESDICGKRVRVELPELLVEGVDCFISVPVLKVHTMTTVSISLKNSWGCVPDTMRGMHHQNLAYKLALIAKLLKPRIVVVDGSYALNKHGPMYGEAVQTNLVLVTDNVVTADALGALIMGFPPQKVAHIAIAEKTGLGTANLLKFELNKDWRPYRKQFQIKKTFVDRLSLVPFKSDLMAKIIFQSMFTPLIYKVAALFRNSKEKELACEADKRKGLGPY